MHKIDKFSEMATNFSMLYYSSRNKKLRHGEAKIFEIFIWRLIKMAENPFIKQEKVWKPPDKAENPYRAATVKRQVVYVKPAEIPFSTADFAPKDNGTLMSAQKSFKRSQACD